MQALSLTLQLTSRRMRAARFVQCLTDWGVRALMLLAAIIVVDKSGLLVISEWGETGIWRSGGFAPPTLSVPLVYLQIVLCLAGASVLAACAMVYRENFSDERAALTLDGMMGTRERITSAVEMGESSLPFAQALMEDAKRYCERVDLRRLFPLAAGGSGRKFPWVLLALAAAVLLMPDLDLLGARENERKRREAVAKERKEVDEIATALQKKARDLRKELDKKRVPNEKLKELTKRMEELAKKMENDRKIDSKKAKELINRLQEDMKKEAAAEKSKADKLKNLTAPRDKRSLMRKTSEKMRDNDFKGASEQLEKLRRRLLRKKPDPKELKQLAKDMKDMADQLDKMGLKKLKKEFEEMSKELEDLQSAKNMEKMQRLQEKLADALKNLDSQKGLDTSKLSAEEKELLKQLQEMLSKMEMTEKTLNEMQQAAESGKMRMLTQEDLKKMLQDMKNQKFCPSCKQPGWDGIDRSALGGDSNVGQDGKNGSDGKSGAGKDGKDGVCPVCGRKHGDGNGGSGGMMGVPMPGMGGGMKPGGKGQSSGGQGNGAGMKGAGTGQGGKAPENDDGKHSFEDSRARARAILPGKIIGMKFVRGLDPSDNNAKVEYVDAVEAVESSTETVRERERIPRADRDLVRDYHNKIKGIDPEH